MINDILHRLCHPVSVTLNQATETFLRVAPKQGCHQQHIQLVLTSVHCLHLGTAECLSHCMLTSNRTCNNYADGRDNDNNKKEGLLSALTPEGGSVLGALCSSLVTAQRHQAKPALCSSLVTTHCHQVKPSLCSSLVTTHCYQVKLSLCSSLVTITLQ